MKILKTPMKISIHQAGKNPVYGEGNTFVEIEDEGAGPFVKITQDDAIDNVLRFDLEELQAVIEVARDLVEAYNDNNTKNI
jgi:hypothetical protein